MKTLYFFQLFPDELHLGFRFPYNFQYLDDKTFLNAFLLQFACMKIRGWNIEFLAQTYKEILKVLEALNTEANQ